MTKLISAKFTQSSVVSGQAAPVVVSYETDPSTTTISVRSRTPGDFTLSPKEFSVDPALGSKTQSLTITKLGDSETCIAQLTLGHSMREPGIQVTAKSASVAMNLVEHLQGRVNLAKKIPIMAKAGSKPVKKTTKSEPAKSKTTKSKTAESKTTKSKTGSTRGAKR